jgi:hypothetical protein
MDSSTIGEFSPFCDVPKLAQISYCGIGSKCMLSKARKDIIEVIDIINHLLAQCPVSQAPWIEKQSSPGSFQ